MAAGGVPEFYKGLSAALTRQATYAAVRMGLFNVFSKEFLKANKQQSKFCFCHVPHK
jgi:hypothetical protein